MFIPNKKKKKDESTWTLKKNVGEPIREQMIVSTADFIVRRN